MESQDTHGFSHQQGPVNSCILHQSAMSSNLATAWTKSPSWPYITNLRRDPYERFYLEGQMDLRWFGSRMSLKDILQNLDMLAMIDFGARKDKWSFATDSIYFNLGKKITPSPGTIRIAS